MALTRSIFTLLKSLKSTSDNSRLLAFRFQRNTTSSNFIYPSMPAEKSVRDIQKSFFASPHFAVVGASKDQSKFGTRVLKWYQARSFRVTPVHPRETELEGIATLPTIADLPSPSETSISIITPPKVTLGLLQQAKDLSVPALWLQPGAEDQSVVDFVRDNGLSERVIFGGPCILVEGDDIVRSML